MAKKGELSKTARASVGKAKRENLPTKHLCASCNDVIWLDDLFPVKVLGKGLVFYHKEHYKVQ